MKTLFIFICIIYEVYSVVIDTPSGQILGKVKEYGNKPVFQFLNVPYAEPPIGTLRFEKPKLIKSWTGILNATEYGLSCIQPGPPPSAISEDCLVLNIYVPNTIDVNGSSAVMVYIHGGGYVQGVGKYHDGSMLALAGDVIVVTINYRLGVLGFLSVAGDNGLPGNYGMWDQRLSFVWVQNNIKAFGGNRNEVTIFGESAGGYSVGLHLISKKNNGLFQRAVCESGVTLSPRALAFDPISFSNKFLHNVGCSQSDLREVKVCLKSKTTVEILKASGKASALPILAYRLQIAPVVDGDFLPKSPFDLITESDVPFSNIDLMAGTNSAEGNLLLYPLYRYQEPLHMKLKEGIPTRVLCDNITRILSRDYYNNSVDIANHICKQYSQPVGLPDNLQSRQAVDMYGDMCFLAPTVDVLDIHAKMTWSKSTYQYYFTHLLSSNGIKNAFPWFVGVPHAAELAFVFGPEVQLANGTYTQQEVEFSNKLQAYLTNFAKHGNPNGRDLVTWPTYTANKSYMDLNLTLEAKKNIFPDRMNLWLSFKSVKPSHETSEKPGVSAALSTLVSIITILLPLLFIIYNTV